MEHVSAIDSAQGHSATSRETMTVLVIDSGSLGGIVAGQLRKDGHEVHVRDGSVDLFDELEALNPQVVALHLHTGRRAAGEALILVRRRFPHIAVIAYTASTAVSVPSQLKAGFARQPRFAH